MASLTVLSAHEHVALARAFDLDGATFTALPDRGTVNSNYAIDTARDGRFFLRINEGKRLNDVAAEIELLDALLDGGIKTPSPRPTRTGQRFAVVREQAATVFPWINGSDADTTRDNAATQAGTWLAQLHRVGIVRPTLKLPPNHYTLDELEKRLAWAEGTERFGETTPLCDEEVIAARARDRGVMGLIHQDLFPDNVLVDDAADGKFLALLDFEQATRGPLLYDVAVCVNAWCWSEHDNAFDLAACDRLLNAYREGRALPSLVGLLPELRLAAARFTLTRITDIEMRPDVHPDLRARKDYRAFERRLLAWRDGPAATWASTIT